MLQFFIDLHDFICLVFHFFQTDLTGLQYVWLDPTPAYVETDLLKRVYAQITYTIWAGGERGKGEDRRREGKFKSVEHYQDGGKVVLLSLLVLLDLFFRHTALY